MHSVLSSNPANPPEKLARPHPSAALQWRVSLQRWLSNAAASRLVVYSAFTLLYLVPTVRLCRVKLMWDDEFFTFYLSRTPNWHTLIQALSTGADQHPPTFYYLTHLLLHIFGNSHLVLRAPAIFAFWLFCICVYEILRPLANPAWAVAAMLFPLATEFYRYSIEARGYGLVTGFAALAVLSWLHVTRNRHRWIFLPLLAFSLAAGVSSHYYSVLTALSLGIAELVRSWVSRKFDLGVWISFAFSLLPIIIFLPVIRSASKYSSNFWATPVWSDVLRFYPTELGVVICTLLGLFAIVISFGLKVSNSGELAASRQRGPLKSWEATAICVVAAQPVLAMLLAKHVTHAFSDRYAISAVVGVTVLVGYLLSRVVPRSLAALATAVTCLCLFVVQVRLLRAEFRGERQLYIGYTALLSQTGTQQIAIAEWDLMHRLSFYAPRSLASRMSYIADSDASVKFLGQNTADRGALALRPWFPMQIVSVQSFLQSNPSFLVFGATGHWDWLIYQIPKWGDASLITTGPGDRLLFSVDHLRVKPDSNVDEQERIAEANMLFSKMPTTGPSLCALWMGPKDCL